MILSNSPAFPTETRPWRKRMMAKKNCIQVIIIDKGVKVLRCKTKSSKEQEHSSWWQWLHIRHMAVSVWKTLSMRGKHMVMSVSRCLFEGRCVRKIHGRVYLKDTQCVRKTHGRVHKRASRRCSLCVSGVHFLQPFWISKLKICCLFRMWLRINIQYGDWIPNSSRWVMVRRSEAKVENSNQPTNK